MCFFCDFSYLFKSSYASIESCFSALISSTCYRISFFSWNDLTQAHKNRTTTTLSDWSASTSYVLHAVIIGWWHFGAARWYYIASTKYGRTAWSRIKTARWQQLQKIGTSMVTCVIQCCSALWYNVKHINVALKFYTGYRGAHSIV